MRKGGDGKMKIRHLTTSRNRVKCPNCGKYALGVIAKFGKNLFYGCDNCEEAYGQGDLPNLWLCPFCQTLHSRRPKKCRYCGGRSDY